MGRRVRCVGKSSEGRSEARWVYITPDGQLDTSEEKQRVMVPATQHTHNQHSTQHVHAKVRNTSKHYVSHAPHGAA